MNRAFCQKTIVRLESYSPIEKSIDEEQNITDQQYYT